MNIYSSLINHIESGSRFWVEESSQRQPMIREASIAGEYFEEKAEHDEMTAKFLHDKVVSVIENQAQEEGDLIWRASNLFDKDVLQARHPLLEATFSATDNYTAKLHSMIRLNTISKALNIPIKFLFDNQNVLKFIQTNSLMYRIDSSYVSRGYGPRTIDGELCFPVNKGDYLNPDVEWVNWKDLPMDGKMKLQCGYGPYGFEKNQHPQTPDKIVPIKLIDIPEGMEFKSGQVLFELTTSNTEQSLTLFLQKLLRGGPGHSWIKVYEPQLDASGIQTGKCFLYSFGVGTTHDASVFSPDLREFKGDEKFSAFIPVDSEGWLTIRDKVEALQKAFLKKEVDPEIEYAYNGLVSGTCVNFALFVFNQAHLRAYKTSLSVEGHAIWQTHFIAPLSNTPVVRKVLSWLSRIAPESLLKKAEVLRSGYMPWVLAKHLETKVDHQGMIIPIVRYIG